MLGRSAGGSGLGMGRTEDTNPDSSFLEGFVREDEFEEDQFDEARADAAPASLATDDKPVCPRCGWKNTRRSNPKGMIDLLLRTFSLRAFRCRSCGNRFHVMRRSSKS